LLCKLIEIIPLRFRPPSNEHFSIFCPTQSQVLINNSYMFRSSGYQHNGLKIRLKCKQVKWSRYRPRVAQRVGRVIAVLFHDRGTWRGWVVSSTSRPHFTPGEDPVPILQETGWTPRQVWTGGKSRPHRDSIPDRPAGSSVAIQTELPGQWLKCNTYGIYTIRSGMLQRTNDITNSLYQ